MSSLIQTNLVNNIKKSFYNFVNISTTSVKSSFPLVTTVDPNDFAVAELNSGGSSSQTYNVTSTDVQNGYLIFDLSATVGEEAANLTININSANLTTLSDGFYILTIIWNGVEIPNSNTISITVSNFSYGFSMLYGGPSTADQLPSAATVEIGDDTISNTNTIFYLPFYKNSTTYTMYV